jgi:hypothetical protein
MRSAIFAITICLLPVGCTDETDDQATTIQDSRHESDRFRNAAGYAENYSPLGSLAHQRRTNAFFKNLGTSGRTCESCHGAAGGWTPSASDELWHDSHGTDPLFMFTHDNGVCPDSDISTKRKRQAAMKLTLERGATRGGLSVQPTAEFEVTAVEDPYHCSGTTLTAFFGYRKPNPSFAASMKTSVTWAPAAQPDMRATLKGVMVGGTAVHGLTTYVPTAEEQEQAADAMMFNYFAQIEDDRAGRLDDDGARGGPRHLAEQEWFLGINHASTGATTKKVFDIYDAWIGLGDSHRCDDDDHGRNRHGRRDDYRALIAEGQELFNFRQNANGGTCSGCHNSPNVGTRSVYQLFDIGIVDKNDPDLPRIHLRNKSTGEVRIVNNLGRASATGLWSDVGKMSVPILRGLAQRGPYFDSGQARTLDDVVDHYNQRSQFNFTAHEHKALVAFLKAL